MAAGYARSVERRLAVKWGAESVIGHLQSDLRLAHEPVVRAFGSAKVGRACRGAARAFVCNGIWCRERLVSVGGLLLDPSCQLCGAAPVA